MQSKELGETPAPCNHRLDHSACCTAAHPVALCALQGSGLLPSWREANKACSVCLGSKLDRAKAMRGRLGAIQAAAPTVFRYCCARGIQNPPAAPAKKLQWFETLRLLWRRDSVCSKSCTPSVESCSNMRTTSDAKLGDSLSWIVRESARSEIPGSYSSPTWARCRSVTKQAS